MRFLRSSLLDTNVWVANRHSQGQTNWLACDVTNRSKIHRNRYNYIKSCPFFVLKSKQLCISVHSFGGVVYPVHKIYSEFNRTVSFCWCKNFMRLFVGSAALALYCRLIADPYIHIKEFTSTTLNSTNVLASNWACPTLRLAMADPYIYFNGW